MLNPPYTKIHTKMAIIHPWPSHSALLNLMKYSFSPIEIDVQAGSKAELVMSLALLAGKPRGALLICNGYKDAEYMQLV